MEKRKFGRTGLELAVLGFGCGAVGGLMVRGEPAEQERTVAEAIEAGINYFDTAVQYGDGESERNLGRILRSLRPEGAVVGTKVRLLGEDRSDIAGAIEPIASSESVESIGSGAITGPLNADAAPDVPPAAAVANPNDKEES